MNVRPHAQAAHMHLLPHYVSLLYTVLLSPLWPHTKIVSLSFSSTKEHLQQRLTSKGEELQIDLHSVSSPRPATVSLLNNQITINFHEAARVITFQSAMFLKTENCSVPH